MKKYSKSQIKKTVKIAKSINAFVYPLHGKGKIRAKNANIKIIRLANGGYTAIATRKR